MTCEIRRIDVHSQPPLDSRHAGKARMSYRAAFSAFYARNFERRPWVTLAVTNGALGVLADGVAQSLERVSVTQQRERDPKSAPPESGNEAWDWERSGRFLAFGVGMAPLLAEWNRFIEFRFPLRSAAGVVRLSALAKRVAVDQIAFAPFGLALFTGAMGLMERRSIEGTKDKFDEVGPIHTRCSFVSAILTHVGLVLLQMYISALLANWQVWPLVQVINFRYMPLK